MAVRSSLMKVWTVGTTGGRGDAVGKSVVPAGGLAVGLDVNVSGPQVKKAEVVTSKVVVAVVDGV